MQSSSRKLLLGLAALLILGFIIYRSSGMINLADFSGAKLLHALREANPFLLILSVVSIYGCYAIRSLRWQVFQKNLGPSGFWPIYSMTLAGFSAIFLLGRPGEPIRPLLLARKEKLPIADIVGVYVLERVFDFASMAAIAALGLMMFQRHGEISGSASALEAAARKAGFAFSALVLAAIGFLVYLRLHGTAMLEQRLRGSIEAGGWRAKVAGILLGFVRGVQILRTWGDLGLSVLYSIVHWGLIVVIYLWIAHAFGGSLSALSLGDAMLIMAFTLVGSAVQLPGVGGGSQVASFLALTTIFGVEKEPAAVVAIMIWLITFASCAIVGTPLLIHQGLSLGQLKELAEHEKEEVAAAEK
jgi:uncharacterized protein (TIRG00374 family)